MESTNIVEAGTESDEDLIKPIYKNGVFKNPFDTWTFSSFWDVIKLMKIFWLNDTSGVPNGNKEVF